jgi:hypothetical protein
MATRVPLAIVHDNEEPRRRAPRTRVLLSCLLITTTDEYRVKLRDVSPTGAMMEGEKLPPAGTDVVLRRGRNDTFATVAWVEGRRGGLQFDEPLEKLEDWARLPMPIGPSAEALPTATMSLVPQPLTPAEQELGRAWVHPVGRAR